MAEGGLDDLRRQAADVDRRVLAKMKRIDAATSGQFSRSSYKPRLGASVSKLNRAQLNARIQRGDNFLRRTNQFAQLKSGQVVPMAQWKRFKKAEQGVFNDRSAFYDANKGRELPHAIPGSKKGTGETVDQRRAKLDNANGRNMGASTSNSYRGDKQSHQVKNKRALGQLTRAYERKLAQGVLRGDIRDARREFKLIARRLNNKELQNMVNGLSDRQFLLLWSETSFVETLAADYEVTMRGIRNSRELNATESQQLDNGVRESRRWVEWAKNQKNV